MLVQVAHSSELAATQVALVCMAIPGVFGGPGFAVPF